MSGFGARIIGGSARDDPTIEEWQAKMDKKPSSLPAGPIYENVIIDLDELLRFARGFLGGEIEWMTVEVPHVRIVANEL